LVNPVALLVFGARVCRFIEADLMIFNPNFILKEKMWMYWQQGNTVIVHHLAGFKFF
jgi:hypothetical protein